MSARAWIDLADAAAVAAIRAGGKAQGLARLLAAGLPVPRGFVLPPDADAGARPPELTGPLVVRSSASVEDAATGAAPGVFESVRDVEPRAIPAAVARVRASANAPVATAYVAARGIAADVAMAVIAQEQVAPELARGVAYREGEIAMVEAHDDLVARVARLERGAVVERDPGFPLGEDQLVELAALTERAEAAISAPAGVDVEWVLGGGGTPRLWIVQARPIVHRAPRAAGPSPEALAFSRAEPGVVWRWDAAHNPDPLSPAQIALVERVAPIAGYRMRVVEGYLYTAPREDAPAAPVLDRDGLLALWHRVSSEIDAVLAPLEAMAEPGLRESLAAYERAFALYGELSAAIAAVRPRVVPSDGVGSSRVDLQACKLEYSIVSPK